MKVIPETRCAQLIYQRAADMINTDYSHFVFGTDFITGYI